MANEERTVVFLGAGFSKAITSSNSRGKAGDWTGLPLTDQVLSGHYWEKRIARGKIKDELCIDKNHYKALNDILRTDFAADLQTATTSESNNQRHIKKWVSMKDGKPINFENLYAHCLLNSKSPYLAEKSRTMNKYALQVLQVLIWQVFDANLYQLDSEVWRRFTDFVTRVETPRGEVDRNAIVYFSTNFDSVFECAYKHISVEQFKRVHKLSLLAHGEGKDVKRGLDSIFKRPPIGDWVSGPSYKKLHGGITYFTCGNPFCELSKTFHWQSDIQPFKRNCPVCGSFTIPGIVPPTTLKDYAENPRASMFVSQLFEALKEATRVIICGYSFPRNDTLLNSRILNGIHEGKAITEIGVIDKDIKASRKIAQAIQHVAEKPKGVRSYNGFDDFIERA